MEKNNEKLIQEIAQEMFIRHCESIGDQNNFKEILKKFSVNSASFNDATQNRRIIVVVGSGASYEASVATSDNAINSIVNEGQYYSENLKKIINENNELCNELKYDFKIKFDAEIDRLSSVYRLNINHFETKLLALSHFFSSSDLKSRLQKIFACRYCPLLSYEILSHMLKHKFIDAIINFNFDELLDQSIDDEFVIGGYRKIISDGDCPEEILASEEQYNFDEPLYIKPHGTYSHPSTLRFTREDYFGIPSDIMTVIRKLLISTPVTIICIGFAMESFEFNLVINKIQDKSKIFCFDIKKPISEITSQNIMELINVDDKVPEGTEKGNVSQWIEYLWKQICTMFVEGFKPRGIARHLIVSRILGPENNLLKIESNIRNEDKNYLYEYFKRKTVLELVISVAKTKGIIQMSSLDKDRCGIAFYNYKKSLLTTENELEIKSLPDLCRSLLLQDEQYGMEIFKHSSSDKDNGEHKIMTKNNFDTWIEKIRPTLQEKFEINIYHHKELFDKIFCGSEVEVVYGHCTIYKKLFSDQCCKPLKTMSALWWQTLKMLQSIQWNQLLVIAETGEWLQRKQVLEILENHPEKNTIRLYLIVADKSKWIEKNSKWEIANDDYTMKPYPVHVNLTKMNWWSHNKHLTLICNNEQEIESIHFNRRIRSPFIDCFHLSKDVDQFSMKLFIAYWLKSLKSNEQTIQREDINRYITDINGLPTCSQSLLRKICGCLELAMRQFEQ